MMLVIHQASTVQLLSRLSGPGHALVLFREREPLLPNRILEPRHEAHVSLPRVWG